MARMKWNRSVKLFGHSIMVVRLDGKQKCSRRHDPEACKPRRIAPPSTVICRKRWTVIVWHPHKCGLHGLRNADLASFD